MRIHRLTSRASARGLAVLAVATLAFAPAVFAQTAGAQPRIQQPSLKQHPEPQVRSAQSDCVRETNRRGYAVIDTSNFKQFREGWSLDLRVRDRRGRTTEGTCFVVSRTGEVSLYGFGWGDDWDGQTSIEFVCASVDSRYRECQLPVNGRVRLVKRLSDARCTEDQTWGQRKDRVWVNHGCRARFEVTRGGHGDGGGDGDDNLVECASDEQRYRECSIGPGYTARLVRETSKNRCRQDSTWGTRNGVVWVTAGCRAQFQRVRGSGGQNAGGNGGGNNAGGSGGGGNSAGNQGAAGIATAGVACLDEAHRRGLRVLQQTGARQVTGGYRMDMKVRTPAKEVVTGTCEYRMDSKRVRLEFP